MKYIIQGKRSWSGNKNANLSLHRHFRSFSSLPPSVGASLGDGEKVVGIDLGTTFSLIAALEGGRPVVIPSVEGHKMTPSVVAYKKIGHHDEKSSMMMAPPLVLVKKRKRRMIMMVMVSLSLITTCY